jgi:aromatic-L-amino-acid decarboxylase
MRALEASDREVAALMTEATKLAADYWASLEERPSYPSTSGTETARLFDRPWSDEGRGSEVLNDVRAITEHVRPCTGRFFGYVAGSGEPVGAIGDFLASVLNQNSTSWRSAPAAVTIERTVIGWLAEDPMGAIGSILLSGRVRVLNHPRGSDHASPLSSTSRTPCYPH